jgi:hypothetical protein
LLGSGPGASSVKRETPTLTGPTPTVSSF